jgi:hypothetical protein
MEIWVMPRGAPGGNDWLLGHDNGGFDRAIIIYDGRYNGIAMGVGTSYASTVPYPAEGEWTHIVATWSKSSNRAIVYKNGGILAGGQQQTVNIAGDSGSQYGDIGLNGLRAFGNHYFNGCVGQVQLDARVVSADEVASMYQEFVRVTTNGCARCVDDECNDDNVCNGVEFCNANDECESPNDFEDCGLNFVCDPTFGCVRDCDSFAIDGYLQDCSAEFDTIKNEGASLFEALEDANSDISGLRDDLTTLQGDVSTESARIDALEEGLEATNSDVADLQAGGSALAERVGGVEEGLAATNDDVSALQSDLSDLSSSVDAIATNVASILTEISSLGDRLTTLEAFVDSFGPNNARGETGGNQFNSPSEQGSAASDASAFMQSDYGLNHTVVNAQWLQIVVVVVVLLLALNVVLLVSNCCCAPKKPAKGKYHGVAQQYSSDDERVRFRE